MPADHRHRAAFIFLSSIFLSFFSGEADGPCRRWRSRLPAGARNRIAKEQSYRIQGLFVITTQSYFLRIVDPGNDSRREQPGKANGRREGHSAARPPRVRTLPLQLQSACQSRSHVSRIVYNYAYSRGLRRGESGIAAAGRRRATGQACQSRTGTPGTPQGSLPKWQFASRSLLRAPRSEFGCAETILYWHVDWAGSACVPRSPPSKEPGLETRWLADRMRWAWLVRGKGQAPNAARCRSITEFSQHGSPC